MNGNSRNIEGQVGLPIWLRNVYLGNLRKWEAIRCLRQPHRDSARFGQIWSTNFRYKLYGGDTKKVRETRIVVVLSDTEGSVVRTMADVRVVPMSLPTMIDEASDLDLILSKRTNPLGFEAMLEFWNTAQVFTCNLNRYLGEISSERIRSQIVRFWKRSIGLESSVLGIKAGTPIQAFGDTRLLFQDEERRKTEYLREPVKLALASLSR